MEGDISVKFDMSINMSNNCMEFLFHLYDVPYELTREQYYANNEILYATPFFVCNTIYSYGKVIVDQLMMQSNGHNVSDYIRSIVAYLRWSACGAFTIVVIFVRMVTDSESRQSNLITSDCFPLW